ncbi:MAG: M12 family metallo-peptidase, partial [Candidatus Binatia bacterium]
TTTTPTTAAAAGATTDIALMSVYTPQARAAAGGTAQIQAQIQAAVDQANTAFINSNMTARYYLAHSAEVAYNDSGDISIDLNWITGNATVASLRNTHGADMVSLIVDNGGGYCGIGWVQRNPGSSFANYAFQVTARGCLTNQTLAHEHGHNLGMEHDPANSSATSASASYDWSFGHNVAGSFRTIMSYNCPSPCPRVLHYSNPDILYNGQPTGIVNQRDNAQTSDLTAPIVAAFRAGGVTNNPPAFTSDPIAKPNANQGQAYSGTLVGSASDPNADALTFAKSAGPAWLTVGASGTLSGTPGAGDLGLNSFTVSVSDGRGGSDTATMQITVVAPIAAPSNLSVSAL